MAAALTAEERERAAAGLRRAGLVVWELRGPLARQGLVVLDEDGNNAGHAYEDRSKVEALGGDAELRENDEGKYVDDDQCATADIKHKFLAIGADRDRLRLRVEDNVDELRAKRGNLREAVGGDRHGAVRELPAVD